MSRYTCSGSYFTAEGDVDALSSGPGGDLVASESARGDIHASMTTVR